MPTASDTRPLPSSSRVIDDSMTARQIAASVRFGRKVTLSPVDQDEITGYVGGMDRYCYFVLAPTEDERVRKFLVHKSNTLVELHDESTLDGEPETVRNEVRKITTKFRQRIMNDFFSGTPSPDQT